MESLQENVMSDHAFFVPEHEFDFVRAEARKVIHVAIDLEVQAILGRLTRERSKTFRRYFKSRIAYLLKKNHTLSA